ncbi:hypothetical protein SISNIDRAFT_471705 [Sistotremastrum niveocremeum HHB9708]|uniref:DUF6535 domain-containing protein n=1 Tax=Sistotremastrum niveocremeum HHB9708 TaxID=1314777 RepID=A0A164MB23_9AGAM|nr:hypothetical protein SISNIDRAFT_471705 [Sistotremastrum niveocremeum HHB9708]
MDNAPLRRSPDEGNEITTVSRSACAGSKGGDGKEIGEDEQNSLQYDIVLAKTKEKADEWNSTMDVTLIFIALFSAVLTAFLVPATQALLPSPNDSTNSTSSSPPPLPARSAEAVCAFYYLSLITAIIIAVLCALGRQWVRRLTIRPNVKSWRARTFWHIERMRRAERWIQILMEVLYRMLLTSIGLFMTALLYQLWNLSGSFEERATILIATWSLGVILVMGIVCTMIATTYHAVRYQGSVFEGMVSKAIIGEADLGLLKIVTRGREAAGAMKRRLRKIKPRAWLRYGWERLRTANLMDSLKTVMQWVRADVIRKDRRPFVCWVKHIAWRGLVRLVNTARSRVEKMKDWVQLNRIKVECDSAERLLGTYLDQIADASDPTLVERAAASFRYRDWVQYGSGSTDLLKKVIERLTATDMSIRARETVAVQLFRFQSWIVPRQEEIDTFREYEGWRITGVGQHARLKNWKEEAMQHDEEERRAIELTGLLIEQHTVGISQFFSPTKDNYRNILALISLPSDEFVAKCLCISDLNEDFGDHEKIHNWAMEHCGRLIARQTDDFTPILTHIDLIRTMRTLLRGKDSRGSLSYNDILPRIIGNRGIEVLAFLNQWLSENHSSFHSAAFQCAFESALRSHSNAELDISPAIAYMAQNVQLHYWAKAADALLAYLDHHDVTTLLDHSGIHLFLQQCVDADFVDQYGNRLYYSRQGSDDIQESRRRSAQALLERYQTIFMPSRSPHRHSATIDDIEANPEVAEEDLGCGTHVPWDPNESDDEDASPLKNVKDRVPTPYPSSDDLVEMTSSPSLVPASASPESAVPVLDHSVIDIDDSEA